MSKADLTDENVARIRELLTHEDPEHQRQGLELAKAKGDWSVVEDCRIESGWINVPFGNLNAAIMELVLTAPWFDASTVTVLAFGGGECGEEDTIDAELVSYWLSRVPIKDLWFGTNTVIVNNSGHRPLVIPPHVETIYCEVDAEVPPMRLEPGSELRSFIFRLCAYTADLEDLLHSITNPERLLTLALHSSAGYKDDGFSEWPEVIRKCVNLRRLSLNRTAIAAPVPLWIGELHKLELLDFGLKDVSSLFTADSRGVLSKLTSLKTIAFGDGDANPTWNFPDGDLAAFFESIPELSNVYINGLSPERQSELEARFPDLAWRFDYWEEWEEFFDES
jgi:hypothetical protein